MRKIFFSLLVFLCSASSYAEETHTYVNGFCSSCGQTEEPTLSDDGYYLIDNAGKLYWFASKVNAGSQTINGKLTANITDNSNVLNSSGNPNGTPSRTWTPIGNDTHSFKGIFDGQNYVISGLYYVSTNSNYVGLFGCVEMTSNPPATQIKNVILKDSYFSAYKYVGGICGMNKYAEIVNCTNYSTIMGFTNYGGIVGYNVGKSYSSGYNGFNSIGSVHSCANFGVIANNKTSGCMYAGGIVGYQYGALVYNCYNRGPVSSNSYVGGIVGYHEYYSSLTGIYNCYNCAQISGTNNHGEIFGYMIDGYANNCYFDSQYSGDVYGKEKDCLVTNCTSKESSSFSYGEVTYLLTSLADSKVDATVWKQTLGSDTYPVLDSSHKTVYQNNVYCCTSNTVPTESSYSNTSGNTYTNNFATSWTWTNYTSALASFECSTCNAIQTVDATVTHRITASATPTSSGTCEHTATAKFNNTDYTNTKTESYNYNSEYAVSAGSFSVNAGQAYSGTITDSNNKVVVFKMQNAIAAKQVDFDVVLPDNIIVGQSNNADDVYFAGAYESAVSFPVISNNADGSKHFSATNTFTLSATATPIIKIAIVTDANYAPGIYSLNIDKVMITGSDGNIYYGIPSTADIYVGSPTAVVNDGRVTFRGDYSDVSMVEKMQAAITASTTTITEVDLTNVTAWPENSTISVSANPNALIETSTDLKLGNSQNVVNNGNCSNLVLTDRYAFKTSSSFNATNVTYTRSMTNTWGTICLPYTVQSDAAVAYYNIDKIENSTLYLTKIDELSAGTPALVKKLSGDEIAPTSASVQVSSTTEAEVSGSATMYGCFTSTPIADNGTDYKYYIADNKFCHANIQVDVPPFRAYFTVSGENARENVISIADPDDTTTAINALVGEGDVEVDGIFDANGRRLPDLQQGLNIVKMSNGKVQKIMVK